MAGIGFDAHVAACFDRHVDGRRGLATYVRVCARELLAYREATYRIGDGMATVDRRALLVSVANSPQFGNSAGIAPWARLDDGRLDLVVFEESSRLATVCAVPRLFARGASGLRGWSVR